MGLYNYRLSGRGVGDDDRYWNAIDRYRQFLSTRDLTDDGGLVAFFGYDFFHDGGIRGFRFLNRNRDLKMRMDAYIAIWADRDDLPESLEFDLEFKGVVWQTLEQTKSFDGPAVYLYSEIDGLTRRIEQAEKRFGGTFHSLVMECYEGWIAMVFRCVTITPRDADAWTKLLEDPSLELRLYPSQQPVAPVQQAHPADGQER